MNAAEIASKLGGKPLSTGGWEIKCPVSSHDDKHASATVCSTWSGGAKAISKTDWRALAARDVTLLPDHDDPGVAAMDRLAETLKNHGCAIRRVKPQDIAPELPTGWDLADIHPDQDFDTERLRQIIEQAPIVFQRSKRSPLDWADLSTKTPPLRNWRASHFNEAIWTGWRHPVGCSCGPPKMTRTSYGGVSLPLLNGWKFHSRTSPVNSLLTRIARRRWSLLD